MKQPNILEKKRGRKTTPLVFLVDDEAILLDLGELSLKNEGYRIRKFQDPELALAKFLKARPKPTLLISDYALGKTNGLDLIAQCKQACPDLKAVLVSGTVGAEIIANAPIKVDRFISKPYQPEAFAQVIREVLAA